MKYHIPRHSPTIHIAVLEHSLFPPHLHFPITQVSDLPEHLSVDPQKQAFDMQVSESPGQSACV